MVVQSTLGLGHLGLFLALRVNDLVRGRAAAAGFRRVRDSHGYLIQHLVESDRSITELAARMEVSQQAASKMVAELVALGLVESARGSDRRARRIRLSARGWRAVRLARRARGEVERRLRNAVGARRYRSAQRTLTACLEMLGGMDRVATRRVRAPR